MQTAGASFLPRAVALYHPENSVLAPPTTHGEDSPLFCHFSPLLQCPGVTACPWVHKKVGEGEGHRPSAKRFVMS